ncbi:response regulator transcription factor [Pseudoxanthomonas indica]|uniref:DNA-binding response regulator, NarL/FixJ family, contains REC and HTH domains n=1 Tax=Pseudoxanthomonas indica TaxID=428993 RepID=A0A1T5KWR8_9GAMM|nr:LuxR C-terminal-related transcriptional regulator [Pseudoxanthomonas indica]GGD52277.1 DNA-binding response regulator [Pseudoxanthomonas indica]SKC67905.1 DNA-binding response regulator, NarL/FixJ family, contains REC and HTH domains [Pseudoxanthomonas indica]
MPARQPSPSPPAGTVTASQPDPAPRILVAVDKPLIRHGLIRVIEAMQLQAQLQTSDNVHSTRELLQDPGCTILLIDAAQAAALGETGLAGVARCRILLVTAREHAGERALTGQAQACGMLREAEMQATMEALLRTLDRCSVQVAQPDCCGLCLARQTWQPAPLPLSPRERQVFLSIGAGRGPREIAAELQISVKTVESHREKIKHKLLLDSGDALLHAAVRWRDGYGLHEVESASG